jgi:flagellar basal-body rod modification protein FlgD
METSISANYALTQSINNTMMANLIGKEVKIDGDDITADGQESINIGYNLTAEAKSADIKIYNSSGVLVKTISDVDTSKGDHKLTWDFTDNNGRKLANGKYSFEVSAKNNNNDDMTVDVFKYGKIDGIRYSSNGTVIVVGDVEYSISDITEVTE